MGSTLCFDHLRKTDRFKVWMQSVVYPASLPWSDRNWLPAPRLGFHVCPTLHDYDVYPMDLQNVQLNLLFCPVEMDWCFWAASFRTVMMEWVVKCAAVSDMWKNDPCPLLKWPDVYNVAWRQSSLYTYFKESKHKMFFNKINFSVKPDKKGT